MTHKFHKVYSDTPIITEAATNQSTGIIQSSQKTKSERFCRWWGKHGLNFATLVILILTWLAYLRANDLNRKTTILTHTPWVTITNPLVALKTPTMLVVCHRVKNCSDFPIFKMKSIQAVIWDGDPEEPDATAILDKQVSNDTVMPHEEKFFINLVPTPDAEKAVNTFYHDQAKLEIFVQYEDMFHRKFLYETTIRANFMSPTVFRSIDSHIDGLDNFDVPKL